jgi:hypothetical protein
MLNELRTAALERGLSVPSAISSGAGHGTLDLFLDTLRAGIENGLTPFGWIASYSSVSDYSFFRLTTSGDSATEKNVFTLALGSGVTNWQHASRKRVTAAALNEIYEVLRRLVTRVQPLGTERGKYEFRPQYTSSRTTWALEAAFIDASSWVNGSSGGMWQRLAMDGPSGGWLGTQTRNYWYSANEVDNSDSVKTYVVVGPGGRVSEDSETSGLQRDLSIGVRVVDPHPGVFTASGWRLSDAVSEGTSEGTVTIPSGTSALIKRCLEISSEGESLAVFFCPDPDTDVSSSGLDDLAVWEDLWINGDYITGFETMPSNSTPDYSPAAWVVKDYVYSGTGQPGL